jgi:hypothetical protein
MTPPVAPCHPNPTGIYSGKFKLTHYPVVERFDGLGIAPRRIAEEEERRTGTLNLCGLGLTELPPELGDFVTSQCSTLTTIRYRT